MYVRKFSTNVDVVHSRLKWLVQLMSTEGRPMPGLLYEAQVKSTHLYYSPKEISNVGSGREELVPIRGNTALLTIELHFPAEGRASRIEAFQYQLYCFYSDFNPDYVSHIDLLSKRYVDDQVNLWRHIFEKYQVQIRPEHRSYPSPQEIQDLDEGQVDLASIKLGLGDFIFYSVLVAQASRSDVSTGAASGLGVIVGLNITMLLLSKYQALPALPISIALGVLTFVCCQWLLNPYLVEVELNQGGMY